MFEPHRPLGREEIYGSDAATRALSVAAVEHDFVNRVYDYLAPVYDFTIGPALHPGRVETIQRMGIKTGDRVLEVGVGTAINAALYPRDCHVIGIDFSSKMLEKGRRRVARKGVRNVRLMEMDAMNLKFADESFDIVYAPYVISVVPDPVAVTREMFRVCKPGGRVIILNHFRSQSRIGSLLERIISKPCLYIGFKSDLDLPAFLVQANLNPVSIEKVNIPRIWSLITCVKE
jgi:phosphatidylethanolamine/phosphatidyl-N-methylethanolamine N-methyltransferase